MMTDKQLTEDVRALAAHIDATHKYSMSRIYGLYNQVFGTAETPQSCASCLIRKVKALKEWLAEQDELALTKIEEAPKKKKTRAKTKSKKQD